MHASRSSSEFAYLFIRMFSPEGTREAGYSCCAREAGHAALHVCRLCRGDGVEASQNPGLVRCFGRLGLRTSDVWGGTLLMSGALSMSTFYLLPPRPWLG